MINEKLRMKAVTIEDCDVVSMLLQDSIFHPSSYSYYNDTHCLRLMLNRFCWELLHDTSTTTFYRVYSEVFIYNVTSVICDSKFKKVPTTFYNLLTFHASEKEITICFSDNHYMCVTVDSLKIYLKDLHEKYPTTVCPSHKIAY